MAIGTDAAIHFAGTQTSLDNTSGAVNDGAFSAAGDLNEWTNSDDAPQASFVLEFQYPSGTIDGNGVHLYAQLVELVAVGNDEPVVDTGWSPHFLGTFVTDTGQTATTDTFYTLGHLVDLPNNMKQSSTAQKYQFYVLNDCNVQMSAGWDLHVTPIAIGPHA